MNITPQINIGIVALNKNPGRHSTALAVDGEHAEFSLEDLLVGFLENQERKVLHPFADYATRILKEGEYSDRGAKRAYVLGNNIAEIEEALSPGRNNFKDRKKIESAPLYGVLQVTRFGDAEQFKRSIDENKPEIILYSLNGDFINEGAKYVDSVHKEMVRQKLLIHKPHVTIFSPKGEPTIMMDMLDGYKTITSIDLLRNYFIDMLRK